MKGHQHRGWTTSLAAAALLSFGLMLGTTPQARADDEHRECRERVERAENRLGEAVRKHGEGSRQAADRRRDLNVERERCWNRYHGWWDVRGRQWHTDRDWDRDDHDRDHDHDHDHH